jgi:hypothetical protein
MINKIPLYISYYTRNTGYELEAEKLVESLRKFNLDFFMNGIKSLGTWQKNTQYKVKFIEECLDRYHHPLVFTDADSVIEREPTLFNELANSDVDIGVHYRYLTDTCSKLLSGTIFINDTVLARDVLHWWQHFNEIHNEQLEQCNLALAIEAVKERGLKVEELPATYCNIFDLMNEMDPVITHYQASRRFK